MIDDISGIFIMSIIWVICYTVYVHNLEIHNSKSWVAGCIFYNKLPNNMKQIGHNQFKKNWRAYLLRDSIFEPKVISVKNFVILADKQMYRVSYI